MDKVLTKGRRIHMTPWVPRWIDPDITGRPKILLVGRDPESRDTDIGKLFVGPAGEVLERVLGTNGLRRDDVGFTNVVNKQAPGNVFGRHSHGDVERGLDELSEVLRSVRPNIVICLGSEASYVLLGGQWPGSGDGSSATKPIRAGGIVERRGFFWETDSILGRKLGFVQKVITTIHPGSLLHGGDVRGINATIGELLLGYDIGRARLDSETPKLSRPPRTVNVVDSRKSAEEAVEAILAAGSVTCDIEIRDKDTLMCVGFGIASDISWVFPDTYLRELEFILTHPKVYLTFHNGSFDTYFLRTRNGINVRNYTDDTIVQFHCCWPVLAGASEQKGSAKRTQKSLNFLGSLYTKDRFWKDYDWTSDHQGYILNGIDTMVTWDVQKRLDLEMTNLGISRRIYEHEVSLMKVVTSILETGILVDERRRKNNLDEVEKRLDEKSSKLVEMVKPLLESSRETLSRPDLFWTVSTCRCCGGGGSKSVRCWECAGFDRQPKKTELEGRYGNPGKLTKDGLVELHLGPCKVCSGVGKFETFEFNPNSNDQKKVVLYEVLKLPKRYEDGKLTVGEAKLKDVLGGLG